jgi:hypothetical protein
LGSFFISFLGASNLQQIIKIMNFYGKRPDLH